ncbi:MAG TPA: hypothetical protein VLJ58_05495 [Ramlibacter sp.]|nr:hypothetical protein [Ramlibacter sp.]
MIHLASDPNAQRMQWRAAANDGKLPADEFKRGRSGHAWPFLSRQTDRPTPQAAPKSSSDSGS